MKTIKTIKIIDLLTKIANKEELPKEIKFKGIKYTYIDEGYVSKIGISLGGEMGYADEYEVLNEEIEIIEELEEEIEIIEELEVAYEDTSEIDDRGYRYNGIEDLKRNFQNVLKEFSKCTKGIFKMY